VQRESWSSPLRVVRMEIELDETDTERMRPGMRYRGDVDTQLIQDTLLIPLEAVFLDDDEPIVFRRSWIGHNTVRVELGRRSGDRVEVLSGLAEGDRVSRVDLRGGRRS